MSNYEARIVRTDLDPDSDRIESDTLRTAWIGFETETIVSRPKHFFAKHK